MFQTFVAVRLNRVIAASSSRSPSSSAQSCQYNRHFFASFPEDSVVTFSDGGHFGSARYSIFEGFQGGLLRAPSGPLRALPVGAQQVSGNQFVKEQGFPGVLSRGSFEVTPGWALSLLGKLRVLPAG